MDLQTQLRRLLLPDPLRTAFAHNNTLLLQALLLTLSKTSLGLARVETIPGTILRTPQGCRYQTIAVSGLMQNLVRCDIRERIPKCSGIVGPLEGSDPLQNGHPHIRNRLISFQACDEIPSSSCTIGHPRQTSRTIAKPERDYMERPK